jgi:hypothetical protein
MRDITLSSEMEDHEENDQVKLETLRMAVEAGEESGIAEGDVFEEVRSYLRQLVAEKG